MPTVFLMRHGQAAMQAPSDALRPLTPYGKAYTAQIAQQLADILKKHEMPLPTLIHSPFQRAVETANEIEQALGQLVRFECQLATPDDSPQACLDALDEYSGKSFILVTHMPVVAALASLLEHGNIYESQPFQTSEIRAFDIETWGNGCGEYKFRLL